MESVDEVRGFLVYAVDRGGIWLGGALYEYWLFAWFITVMVCPFQNLKSKIIENVRLSTPNSTDKVNFIMPRIILRVDFYRKSKKKETMITMFLSFV